MRRQWFYVYERATGRELLRTLAYNRREVEAECRFYQFVPGSYQVSRYQRF